MATKTAKLSPVQKWDFVGDAKLQEILTRDYKELRRIINAGAQKSTVVLCGSIMEALLVNKLLTDEAEKKYQEKHGFQIIIQVVQNDWGLGKLIETAVLLDYLDDDLKGQAHIVQNYRNLIHPGKEKRETVTLDNDLVIGVVALFNRIVRRLAGPKPPRRPLTPRERFLKKLDQKWGPAEVKVAEQIMAWVDRNRLHDHFSPTMTYAPRLIANGYTYTPLHIRPNGKFTIPFRRLMLKPSIFKFAQNREMLRQRLNKDALGDRIPEKRINGYVTLNLSLLASESALTNFLSIFDWVVTSIKE